MFDPAALAIETMRKSDEYRARLREIDGKLRTARQGRGRRREQMMMLLDQLEAQYQRQKQELTGAWAEIDKLETIVEDLEDRLEKIADEFERDTRQADELIGRIARMDGVLKHVVRVRKTEPPDAAEKRATKPAPAPPPPPAAAARPAGPNGGGEAPPTPADGGGRGDAVSEQERPMPNSPADLARYRGDARDPFRQTPAVNKKA